MPQDPPTPPQPPKLGALERLAALEERERQRDQHLLAFVGRLSHSNDPATRRAAEQFQKNLQQLHNKSRSL